MSTIDACRDVIQSGGSVPRDPVEVTYQACRERLGAVGVTVAAFRRELLAALDGAPVDQLDRKLHAADLYLALGCIVGHDGAWRTFDRTYRGYLLRLATRYCGGREDAEELITDLYHDLVTRPDRPGKLHHYKGYAPLATWLAVIVRRMAMDRGRTLERRGGRQRRLQADVEATTPSDNPERRYARAEAMEVAGRLFADALRSIHDRHGLVLALLYRDGLTLREAGRVMDLDFSTVSRRAKAAREALHAAMLDLAQTRHGLAGEAAAALFTDGGAGASFAASEGADLR